MKVADVMSTRVVSVRRSTPLKDVARLLVDNGISGVPVLDEDGSIAGVVSEADLLVKAQGAEAIRHRPLSRWMGDSAESRAELAKLEATSAGDAMTSPAVTIGANRPLDEAARTMTREGVNRLPVVDEGRVVGIVTRADVVRAYVRPDGELAEEIRQEVLLRMLWLDPALFEVEVTNGVARVEGRVERRSTAEIAERMVLMVPGIVDVHADLAWTVDDRKFRPASRNPEFPYGPQ